MTKLVAQCNEFCVDSRGTSKQLLQNATILLQSVTVVTKCDNYSIQSATEHLSSTEFVFLNSASKDFSDLFS